MASQAPGQLSSNQPAVRVVPRLDIKNSNLVKGIHLEGLRVMGKPERFARMYYEHGADELIYMDIVASLYGRNNLLHIVERTAREVFIPLTVGGGLRSLDDIQTVLRAGADKVALNTAAVNRPEFVSEAARKFGSSTIVVSIEAMKRPGGNYEAFTDNGRERTGRDALEWAKQAAELGAGEILITSVEREGTGKGFDLDLVRTIAETVPIPVIASGGAGNVEHVAEAFREGRAQAVAVASILHYHYLKDVPHDPDEFEEGVTAFLESRQSFCKVEGCTLPQLKSGLTQADIPCRK